jgi:hypothetical protein
LILKEDPAYFADLFLELADAFFEQSSFTDAALIYEKIMESNIVRTFGSLVGWD